MSASAGEVREEAARPPIVRHPSDLLRLLVAFAFTLFGLLLATVLSTLSQAVAIEVIEAFDGLPRPVVVVLIYLIGVFVLLLPLVAVAVFAWRRRWRRLGVGLLAAVIAGVLLRVLEATVLGGFAKGALPFDAPPWICPGGGIPSNALSCIPNTAPDGNSLAWLAAMVAFYATMSPLLNHRWHRTIWLGVAAFTTVAMIDALRPPIDAFLAIGFGYTIGAAVVLVLGERDRHPRGPDVIAALARSGIDVATVERASVDARGSVPYFGTTTDGARLFVKVLTPEERAADLLFRLFRIFRLKGVGDERPFSSLRREVEHEALLALKARSDGIRTPRFVAMVEIPPTSFLLAYEAIDGRSLDGVEAEALTDDVLAAVWGQVAQLRVRRTAHRDLRLANVFLGRDGQPWLIDFGFSELAATDGQLRSDVAELLVSTATVVGASRAVDAAVAGIGAEAVAASAGRIQPLALSGATRTAMKAHKGLAEELRAAIETGTGIAPEPLEDLERVKRRSILMAVGLGLAMYFLIPQLAQTNFGAVLGADWRWAPAILFASFLTYVGAAWNVNGSVPEPVRLVPMVVAQFAGTFINRITPGKVGGMATNLRFLQKSGVDGAEALAGVGISNVATIAIHLTLLTTSVLIVGRDLGSFISLPSGNTVLIGLVVLFTISGLVALVPYSRHAFAKKVWPAIRRSASGLALVAHTPSKAVQLFGGAFLSIVMYIAALYCSLAAFGGGLAIAGVALVFLGGAALGNLAPTPGGIGATEAAMIAAFTALGVPADTAVPTVFLFRIATFWLPIVPGAFALRRLEHEGMI